jgi:hypothetical protein
VTEFPDTELSRRLRANRGRRLRPEFAARIERAFGYRPDDADFLDVRESDRLAAEVRARLRTGRSRTWPESRRAAVFEHVRQLADLIGEDHSSYLACFGGWEDIGALRVRSRVVLEGFQEFWEEGREPVCLLNADLGDGLFLDYTDPEQLYGADEYELYGWGAFDPA